jgi:drug/metabolite transporter (DMT)-like permease
VSVTPILTRSLRYGGIVAGVVLVLGGVVGFVISGVPGLLGAVVGAVLSAVFLGLTAVSMLLGGRAAQGDGTSPVFFGVVLGFLGLKLVLFLVFALWLRTQDWMDARVFAVTAIIAVLGSLVADLLAFARARVPYVSDVRLPGEEGPKP